MTKCKPPACDAPAPAPAPFLFARLELEAIATFLRPFPPSIPGTQQPDEAKSQIRNQLILLSPPTTTLLHSGPWCQCHQVSSPFARALSPPKRRGATGRVAWTIGRFLHLFRLRKHPANQPWPDNLCAAFSEGSSDAEVDRAAVTTPGRARKPAVKEVELEEDDAASTDKNGIAGGEDEEEDDDDEEEEVYVVEKILSHMMDQVSLPIAVIARVRGLTGKQKGTPLFEVKWEGYDKKSDRTWEPEEHLM